jgi:hypothetical protein
VKRLLLSHDEDRLLTRAALQLGVKRLLLSHDRLLTRAAL